MLCDLTHVTFRCCILPDNKDLFPKTLVFWRLFPTLSPPGPEAAGSRRARPGPGRAWRVFARIALNPAYFDLAGDKSENG